MKTLIFSLLFVAILSYANGGTKKEKSFHSTCKYGVSGGMNFCKILYKQNIFKISSLYAVAWQVGGYANITLSDKVIFQPALLYSVKGDKSLNYSGGSKYLTYSLSYVELPLLFKFSIHTYFYILTGLYAGYLTSYSSNYVNTVYSNSTQGDNNLNDHHTFDMGVVTGVGYEWKNGFNSALKISQGVTDIVPEYNSKGDHIIPEFNQSFSFCLGWTFK